MSKLVSSTQSPDLGLEILEAVFGGKIIQDSADGDSSNSGGGSGIKVKRVRALLCNSDLIVQQSAFQAVSMSAETLVSASRLLDCNLADVVKLALEVQDGAVVVSALGTAISLLQ